MTGTIDIVQLRTGVHLDEELAADVRLGLSSRPKSLPSKYFYDERGSRLFDAITQLPEYYAARTETGILEEVAGELVEVCRPDEVVEIGGGFSRKTELLLEPLARSGGRYVSLDVSADALREAGERLTVRFPELDFTGVVGDFHTDLGKIPRSGVRLVAFLGSTLGNLQPEERVALLASVRGMLQEHDHFLLGVDLVKPVERLEAAYDDAAGVTADFNLNVLHVLNRELSGDLPVDAFRHQATFNPEEERIEMRLVATRPIEAHLTAIDLTVRFEEGEGILTEISSKFRRAGIERELAEAGLVLERWFQDKAGDFGLALAAPA
jgi:L-histidine N-alpha-methyltransferase